jgi:hypothetical protein
MALMIEKLNGTVLAPGTELKIASPDPQRQMARDHLIRKYETLPQLLRVYSWHGCVPTDAIERAAARVRQLSLRCRVVKEVDVLQRALLDPSSELDQSLQSMRRAVEVFGAKLEESQFSVSLTASDYADSLLDAQVLDEIVSFLSQFLILSNSELLIITLWIAHTWAFETSDATPYLAVTSAEMRSGKTRLLEVLELLVRNPWRTERVTPAALYRKIEVDSPTLLLDEWDATVRSDQKFSETLRGILNAGHRRNGKVSVCGSEKVGYTPTDFHVYCPKVIAGIGKLPNTLADRSL